MIAILKGLFRPVPGPVKVQAEPDALARREAAIQRAKATRSHRDRLRAQEATLACLVRGRN
jgi:hypothetical protein